MMSDVKNANSGLSVNFDVARAKMGDTDENCEAAFPVSVNSPEPGSIRPISFKN